MVKINSSVIFLLLLFISLPLLQVAGSTAAVTATATADFDLFLPIDNDTETGWHLERINAQTAWAITQGSNDIVVAILDCGIDFDHSELIHAQWVNDDEIPGNWLDDDNNGYIDDLSGWNFVDGSSNNGPRENGNSHNNHGTFIAGLIAAAKNNQGIVGIAPNVKLMDLTVWYDSSADPEVEDEVWATQTEIAQAIQYAVENGADVISCSFTYKKRVFDKLSDAAFYDEMKEATKKDVVICASAGNHNSSHKRYPACFRFVIGVGASDFFNEKASYSSYGSWIDLVGPAGDHDDNIDAHRLKSTHYGENYTFGCGTSYSTPLVAGVVALMKSVDGTISFNKIRCILQRTAIDLGSEGKDDYFGYGLVDAGAAVRRAETGDMCILPSTVGILTLVAIFAGIPIIIVVVLVVVVKLVFPKKPS